MKFFAPAIFAAFGIFGSAAYAGDCDQGQLDIKSGGDSVRFSVEIADTNQERALGLLNREYMGQFSGMLFVYDGPRSVAFWMKNTLIPLDMLFIDEAGVVTRIHENAIPLDLTGIPGGDSVQYVLEINGGMVDMLDIKVGSSIRHPEISRDLALWPCND